jgi:hypothetical protein
LCVCVWCVCVCVCVTHLLFVGGWKDTDVLFVKGSKKKHT